MRVLIPLLVTSLVNLVFSAVSDERVKMTMEVVLAHSAEMEGDKPAGLAAAGSEHKRLLAAVDINHFDPELIDDAQQVVTDLDDLAKMTLRTGDGSDQVQAQFEPVHTNGIAVLEAARLETVLEDYFSNDTEEEKVGSLVGTGAIGTSSGVASPNAATGVTTDNLNPGTGKQTHDQQQRDAGSALSSGVNIGARHAVKEALSSDGAVNFAGGGIGAPGTYLAEEKMALWEGEADASVAKWHASKAVEHEGMAVGGATYGSFWFRARDAANNARSTDFVDQESLIAKASVIEAMARTTLHKSTEFDADKKIRIDLASRLPEVDAIAIAAIEAAEAADAQERFVEQKKISRQRQLPYLHLLEINKIKLQSIWDMRKSAAWVDWASYRRELGNGARSNVDAEQTVQSNFARETIAEAATVLRTSDVEGAQSARMLSIELVERQEEIRSNKEEWMSHFLQPSSTFYTRDAFNQRRAHSHDDETEGVTGLLSPFAPEAPENPIHLLRPVQILPPSKNFSINFAPVAPSPLLSKSARKVTVDTSLSSRRDDANYQGLGEAGVVADWSHFQLVAAAYDIDERTSSHVLPNVSVTPLSSLSAAALSRINLRRYQFVIDTQEKRYRFGALPEEAESALEPVYGEIIARTRSMPGAAKGQSVPVVEDDILFMHSLAATKFLISFEETAKARAAVYRWQLALTWERIKTALMVTKSHFTKENRNFQGSKLLRGVPDSNEATAVQWRTSKQRRGDRLLVEEALRLIVANVNGARRDGLLRRQRLDYYRKVVHAAIRKHRDQSERQRSAERHFVLSRARFDGAELHSNSSEVVGAHRYHVELEVLNASRHVELQRIRSAGRTALAAAVAEVREEALRQRLNEDIHLRAIAAEGRIAMEKAKEAIHIFFITLGRGVSSLLSDKQQLLRVVLSAVAVLTGAYFSREGAVLARVILSRRFSRPALVRETSRSSGVAACFFMFYYTFVAFVAALRRLFTPTQTAKVEGCRHSPHSNQRSNEPHKKIEIPSAHKKVPGGRVERLLKGIVFNDSLRDCIADLALSLSRAHARSAPLRHVLLYGPPGTGKTMVARRLATLSGLDYAIMSGGDLGPLGETAVSELHLLMGWAKSSPRGLLLFVDEAEAALGDRRKVSMSETAQNVLNTMLFHTGDQSSKFMLVLATNRPHELDEALLDRMDEIIQVPLPELPQRRAICRLYYAQCLQETATLSSGILETLFQSMLTSMLSGLKYGYHVPLPRPQRVADSTSSDAENSMKLTEPPFDPIQDRLDVSQSLEELAEVTDGFSGREIHKLLLSVQGAVHSSYDNCLTKRMWQKVVRWKLTELKEVHRNVD